MELDRRRLNRPLGTTGWRNWSNNQHHKQHRCSTFSRTRTRSSHFPRQRTSRRRTHIYKFRDLWFWNRMRTLNIHWRHIWCNLLNSLHRPLILGLSTDCWYRDKQVTWYKPRCQRHNRHNTLHKHWHRHYKSCNYLEHNVLYNYMGQNPHHLIWCLVGITFPKELGIDWRRLLLKLRKLISSLFL